MWFPEIWKGMALHLLVRGYLEYTGLLDQIVFRGTNSCTQLFVNLSQITGIIRLLAFLCKSWILWFNSLRNLASKVCNFWRKFIIQSAVVIVRRCCTEVLASLPFTCAEEPLYLIYDINRVIQLRAGAPEANMKLWSSCSQQWDLMSTTNDSFRAMPVSGLRRTLFIWSKYDAR